MAQGQNLHPMLRLQREVGNQAVLGLLLGGVLQAKLAIAAPGDVCEQEAERISAEVTRPASERVAQWRCTCGQRTAASGECGECRKKGQVTMRRRSSDAAGLNSVAPIVHDVLSSPGQLLDEGTRAFMEPRFGRHFSWVGYDLSGIRIHTDAKAAESARSVNALAYTLGQHIVFGQGQYQPYTHTGATLIAHELTHVIQQSGARDPGAGQSTNERCLLPSRQSTTEVIARQAAGWSDAPAQDPNRTVTTVDEKGNIVTGQVKTKGVWRVPLEGLHHGLQKGGKGPAFESPIGRAVVLIPNTVKPVAVDKDGPVPVDVLLHLHGYGVGYRQLRPGQHDDPGVLEKGQLRDVDLYQMEQQLLSLVEGRKRLIVAVLPQGSEGSVFGDLRIKSDAYLDEVFANLIPTFLPEKAVPGRVTVSAHSAGGRPAMAIAEQRTSARKPTDVILFDAINFSKETCTSKEITRVEDWVSGKINADIASLTGVPEEQQPAKLETDGTRFRGLTSGSLKSTDPCSYGFYYSELKKHIDATIKKLRVSEAVRGQLRQNYQVLEAKGLAGFKGTERHERMIGAQNLEDALKD